MWFWWFMFICNLWIPIFMILLIVSIFPTEAALKKTFYEDGTRR